MFAPLLFALVLALLAMVALAFTRGGPTETPDARQAREEAAAGPPPDALSVEEFARLLSRMFSEMGFAVSNVVHQADHVDLLAEDDTPITGNRMYVRGFPYPSDGMIQSSEVQQTLDAARGEGLTKAVLVTPRGFSEEASAMARQTAVDLIDGVELERLFRRHCPDAIGKIHWR